MRLISGGERNGRVTSHCVVKFTQTSPADLCFHTIVPFDGTRLHKISFTPAKKKKKSTALPVCAKHTNVQQNCMTTFYSEFHKKRPRNINVRRQQDNCQGTQACSIGLSILGHRHCGLQLLTSRSVSAPVTQNHQHSTSNTL